MIRNIGIIFVLFLCLVTVSCGNKAAPALKEGHDETAHSGHAENEAVHPGEQKVLIEKSAREIIGLELKQVSFRNMEDILDVTGEIAKDTEKIFHVTPKTAGNISEITVKYGDSVKPGDVLGIINFSGKTEEIVSEYTGIVTGISIKEGQYVDEITSLFALSDMSIMNANFDVYEKDTGKVKIGQKIYIKSIAYPDKVFAGRIVFISLRVDENTRTIKARAEIDNPDYLLKFNMYVTGKIVVNRGQYLSVPAKSIQTIGGKQVVFVVKSKDEFAAREITAGFEENGYVQVLNGLNPGDRIAAGGSFLLKSELLKTEMGDGCAD